MQFTQTERIRILHDYSGQKIDKLLIIRPIGKSNNKRPVTVWECKCDCGTTCYRTSKRFRDRFICSCGCAKKGPESVKWKGTDHICASFYSRLIYSAKVRSIECNITIEELERLYLLQNKRCALSGVILTFDKKRIIGTASCDRINPDKGYINGNVQLVHKDINMMKQKLSQVDFISWCEAVTIFNKVHNGKDL